ncbi:unnamed protein product, partial [marine sediment metagenome]
MNYYEGPIVYSLLVAAAAGVAGYFTFKVISARVRLHKEANEIRNHPEKYP